MQPYGCGFGCVFLPPRPFPFATVTAASSRGRLAGVLSTTGCAAAARPACLYRDKRRAYEREDAERHHRAPHPHCRLLLPDDPIRFTHRRDVVYLIVFR